MSKIAKLIAETTPGRKRRDSVRQQIADAMPDLKQARARGVTWPELAAAFRKGGVNLTHAYLRSAYHSLLANEQERAEIDAAGVSESVSPSVSKSVSETAPKSAPAAVSGSASQSASDSVRPSVAPTVPPTNPPAVAPTEHPASKPSERVAQLATERTDKGGADPMRGADGFMRDVPDDQL